MAGGMTPLDDNTRNLRFSKTRDRALTPAAQGLSCDRAGQWAGGVKSAIGKWLRRTPLPEPQLSSGGVLKAGRVRDSYARRASGIEGSSRC